MMQDKSLRVAIASMGYDLHPQMLPACRDLFADELSRGVEEIPILARDIAYGSDARNRLDIYASDDIDRQQGCPIFVWVHGGGFVRGDKRAVDHPFEAHIGRFAARNGFLGVVMNYRLAPEHHWPAGGEDVGSVVDWLKANAHQWGGDPARIVLAGTSAGAAHVSTYLRLRPATHEVCAAILLSGLYGFTPLEDRDRTYYPEPEEIYTERNPLAAVIASDIPIFVACAEFDPPRFQTETLRLMSEILLVRGHLPPCYVASGHNHYSLAMHLGTSDTRLADELLAFANAHCAVSRDGRSRERN
jgi:arylformamidase